ncbi:MAG: aminopeptidase P family N-terminal domain-containing protein, partial [Solirubrobacteraceae bacterium]
MSDRAQRLTALLAAAEVDLLLVSDQVNLRYLTGYTGDNGLALVGPGTRTFITDFRYVEQAAEEVDPAFERRQAPLDLLDAIDDALPPGPVALGFEDATVSVRSHARMRELLDERVTLVAAGSLVERLRAIKEPAEIARIRAAAALADEALAALLSDGLIGRTERDLALAL